MMSTKTLPFLLLLFFSTTPTLPCPTNPTIRSHRPPHLKPHHNPPPATIRPPSTTNCSVDVSELGLCLDVLADLLHTGEIGDPVQYTCCPVISGLVELEAAACLCTAIRVRILDLEVYLPLANNVLLICGKSPPLGFICP